MNEIFALQRRLSRSERAPSASERRDTLEKLELGLQAFRGRLIEAIDLDFGGRSRSETELLELLPVVRAIRHARRHVASWMRDERKPVEWLFQPSRNWIRHEPVGVVGILAPWNYPLYLTIGPLVDAFAAGNRVMLKPSELTPRFSEVLARMIGETFPAAQVSVVTGGVDVAKAFSALPFDHLVFTGSTAVGRIVMRAAAENLTPVTLELGGKSPAIVAGDYGLADAARSIAFGKFLNSGQTCIAPDYVLLPEGAEDPFVRAIMDYVAAAFPNLQENSDYTAIVSSHHRARLQSLVDEARDKGAKVIEAVSLSAGARQFAPTVVVSAPEDCRLMQEEIFGPILPVLTYRSLNEALETVKRHERPLALYLFTHDRKVEEAVLNGVTSGGVTINGTLRHIAQGGLPFGGIGPSGIGAYHGHEGFLRLSHARSVHKVGFVNAFERMGPPWGRLKDLVVRLYR